MRNSNLSLFLSLVVLSIPLIYLAFIYKSLPQIIATHFGAQGKADDFGDKSSLIVESIVLSAVSFGIYLLVSNIHKIDPKKTANYNADIMRKIGLAVVVLCAAINLLIISSGFHKQFVDHRFLFPMMSLFFAYMGYVMYDVKPNYFCGFRTPWALENEDNWKQTHHLAGKLWCVTGVVIAVVMLFLPFMASFILFSLTTIVLTVTPFVYSYQHFKRNKIAA